MLLEIIVTPIAAKVQEQSSLLKRKQDKKCITVERAKDTAKFRALEDLLSQIVFFQNTSYPSDLSDQNGRTSRRESQTQSKLNQNNNNRIASVHSFRMKRVRELVELDRNQVKVDISNLAVKVIFLRNPCCISVEIKTS